MWKKIFVIAITVCSVTGFGVMYAPKALASVTWCEVLAYSSSFASCQNGTDPGLYNVDTSANVPDDFAVFGGTASKGSATSNQLKSNLISLLDSYDSSGYNHLKVGARYVECTMAGGSYSACRDGSYTSSDWKTRLNNPNIVLSEENYSYSLNTAYDPSANNIVQYSDSAAPASLVFRDSSQGNKIVYAVKWFCGNPLDNLPGLPEASARVQGYVVLDTGGAINSGGTVWAGSASDTPGASAFYLDTVAGSNTMKITGVNSTYTVVGYKWCGTGSCSGVSTTAGSSFSKSLAANTTYSMRWVVKVANSPPTGSINVGACNSDGSITVKYTFNDTDQSSNETRAYTKVYTGTPTRTVFPADADNVHVSAFDNNGWTLHGLGTSVVTNTIPASQTTGAYTAWLFAQDVGSSGDHAYYLVDSKPVQKCNSKPTISSFTAKCTGSGSSHTYTFNMSFSDADGATTAHLTTGSATGTTIASGVTNGYTHAVNNTWEGYWPIYLVVPDVGPGSSSANNASKSVSKPACPTTGTINATCSGITVFGYNPDAAYAGGKVTLTSDGVSKSVDSGDSYKFTRSTASDWNSKSYSAVVNYGARTSGTLTDSAGPCAVLSCSTNPSNLAGTLVIGSTASFKVNVTVTGVSTAPPATVPGFTVVVKDPNGVGQTLSPASPVPYDSYSSGKVYSKSTSFKPTKVGTYSVSVSWSYPGHATGSASGCGDTAKAAYAPYFAVAGGDVSAGPGFGSSCSADTSAIIKGWNTGSTGSFAGAGTTLGAFALSNITGFATGQGGVATAAAPADPGAPSQLAFANTTATGKDMDDVYGGQFGLKSCVPDYQAAALARDGKKNFSTQTFDLTGKDSGIYRYTGTGPLTLHGTVGAGKQITLVTNGRYVFIDGDITYGSYSTDYTGVSQIPQFQLLVKGNIYVSSTVQNLYGFYDAQKTSTGSGGNIFTCATATNTAASDYGTCSTKPLTFYGAVAANKIYLERSYGNIVANGAIPADAAEKIVFTPELWMTAATPSTTGTGLDDWQAAVSLPPIL